MSITMFVDGTLPTSEELRTASRNHTEIFNLRRIASAIVAVSGRAGVVVKSYYGEEAENCKVGTF